MQIWETHNTTPAERSIESKSCLDIPRNGSKIFEVLLDLTLGADVIKKLDNGRSSGVESSSRGDGRGNDAARGPGNGRRSDNSRRSGDGAKSTSSKQ